MSKRPAPCSRKSWRSRSTDGAKPDTKELADKQAALTPPTKAVQDALKDAAPEAAEKVEEAGKNQADAKKNLAQNDAVKTMVTQSAEALLAVNVVLQRSIPDKALSHEVSAALQKNEKISDAIAESADELQAVNEFMIQIVKTIYKLCRLLRFLNVFYRLRDLSRQCEEDDSEEDR